MIRLTELDQQDQVLNVKIEGHFTAATLQILGQALVNYQARNLEMICCEVNGLISVDRYALEKARDRFPHGLEISFKTRRIALQQLLNSCGFKVELSA